MYQSTLQPALAQEKARYAAQMQAQCPPRTRSHSRGKGQQQALARGGGLHVDLTAPDALLERLRQQAREHEGGER